MRLVSAYIAVVLIWSTSPLAIKWSTDSLTFIAAAGARMTLGALICALLMTARRMPLPLHRGALVSYASAVLGVFGAMSSVYWAVQFIPSAMASVMFGLAPILSGVFAWFILDERVLTWSKIAGIVVALGGLSWVFLSEMRVSTQGIPGLIAALCGTAFFALSSVLVKRTSADIDALAHTTGSLWMSLPLFAVTWWLLDGDIPQEISVKSAASVLYLGFVGSVIGFVLFLYVLRRLPAVQVALVPLITPAFALMLGAVLAGEIVTGRTLAGAAIILGGLMIYQFTDPVFRWTMRRHRQGVPS